MIAVQCGGLMPEYQYRIMIGGEWAGWHDVSDGLRLSAAGSGYLHAPSERFQFREKPKECGATIYVGKSALGNHYEYICAETGEHPLHAGRTIFDRRHHGIPEFVEWPND